MNKRLCGPGAPEKKRRGQTRPNGRRYARLALLLAAALLLLTLTGCGDKAPAGLPEMPEGSCVLDEADILSPETEQYVTSVTASLSGGCGCVCLSLSRLLPVKEIRRVPEFNLPSLSSGKTVMLPPI